MKIVLFFLFMLLIFGSTQAYSSTTNTLTVTYSNNYAPSYVLEIDSDQSFVLTQSYSWIREQSSRYNLMDYTIDGQDFTPISRKPRGNLTLDITMDKPHSIMFTAVPQFPLVVKGISNYEFNPKSPTDDNWFDSGTNAVIQVPSITHTSADTRKVIVSWLVDNKQTHYTNDDSDLLSIGPIMMTDARRVDFSSKTQHKVAILTDYGKPYGDGWYDEGSTATIGVNTSEQIFGKSVAGWEGHTTSISGNPSVVIVDSPKTLTARWVDNYLFVVVATVASIISLVLIAYAKKLKHVKRGLNDETTLVPTAPNDLGHDNTYDLDINQFLEEQILESLESYRAKGLVNDAKYSRIKSLIEKDKPIFRG